MSSKRLTSVLLLVLLLGAAWFWQRQPHVAPTTMGGAATAAAGAGAAAPARTGTRPDFLPPEAADTLRLIARGGPFPHRQDGAVFGNYEGLLPARPRGYYHEYTVETPGARDRGARRIITGGTPPREYYYTGDHYRSFRRFEP
ncbi:ribonuclease domain-containing protein [Fulvimonas soli]|jgi:guanyl-specific ribonuclease Sa|uniref:Guanyl-specific ribonuclease Sa n=1 Tax=Fulvimonas soli TaxID=155197 RepID=A0A316HY82_9GAMM|nr:ribonuclease domain-containing protein [Fulvimonas soli]PWK85326.1 guanyl-specific ribonuclease Sa [Fulvimonas soli]TNY27370.1 ribonuclease [Fulvimonas soli]